MRPLRAALSFSSLLVLVVGCDSSGGTNGNVSDTRDGDTAVATDTAVADDTASAGDTLAVDDTTPDASTHHPAGWSAADMHGPAFNAAGPSDCATCHGAELTGGLAVGCADCHATASPDWTTDCTFCHGGMDNDTGAPPEAIDGTSARSFVGVGAHSAHVVDTALHTAFACTTCHPAVPESIFSDGHIDGDGVAENAFSGLAEGASFDGAAATCSAVYCHGDGRTDGTATWTSTTAMSCSSCHPTSGNGMSGQHRKHISHNVSCAKCHADVATGSTGIASPTLHVNGTPDVHLSQGTWDASARRCSNTCHSTKSW